MRVDLTVFPDTDAKSLKLHRLDWDDLVAKIRSPGEYASKESCPLLKLGRFGKVRTGNKCLRHNDNLLEISGIEGDYDGEQVTIAEASMMLHEAGIEALLYTSPRHRPDAPRWRVLAPLSKGYPPTERSRFTALVNGALGGILTSESFTLSQSFYVGKVSGAAYDVQQVRGQCVDLVQGLVEIYPKGVAEVGKRDETTDAELLEAFKRGENRLKAAKKLAARYVGRGMDSDDALAALLTLLEGSVEPDPRKRERLKLEFIHAVETARRKFGDKRNRVNGEDHPAVSDEAPPVVGPNGESAIKDKLIAEARRAASWQSMALQLNDKGAPIENEYNAIQILGSHPDWAGRIWFDTFHSKLYVDDHGIREWRDDDDVALQVWFQGVIGLRKIGIETVRRAVSSHARAHARDEYADWLRSLHWGGIARCAMFFHECMGAEDTPYVRAASANFWRSMAARGLHPGCQVDYMPILEGKQGIGKSKGLRIIGGPWYAEIAEPPTSKEFFLNIQGMALIEIAELDAFSRAETTRVKAAVSCPVDRMRMPYDARAQVYPRRCVFVGTTNDHEYLRDPTGGRRFWPIATKVIRLDLIEANRDQLFAEAAHDVLHGAPWWEMPSGDTEAMQESRRIEDPWEEPVLNYASQRERVVVVDVLTHALEIPKDRHDKSMQMRVTAILKAADYHKSRGLVNGENTKFWVIGGKGGKGGKV